MSSTALNSIYRQQKRGRPAAAGKPSSKLRPSSKPSSIVIADSSSPNPKDKVVLSVDDEEMLKKFDLDMKYGPCLGMTRMERWHRAAKLGLDPPADVERILLSCESALECLWEGRV